MKKIKVDKVILYYMDRVDPDGNPYRFYVYKGMASDGDNRNCWDSYVFNGSVCQKKRFSYSSAGL